MLIILWLEARKDPCTLLADTEREYSSPASVGSQENPAFSNMFSFVWIHSKAGISDIFEGHYGPVTGIDTHSAAGQVQHNNP